MRRYANFHNYLVFCPSVALFFIPSSQKSVVNLRVVVGRRTPEEKCQDNSILRFHIGNIGSGLHIFFRMLDFVK